MPENKKKFASFGARTRNNFLPALALWRTPVTLESRINVCKTRKMSLTPRTIRSLMSDLSPQAARAADAARASAVRASRHAAKDSDFLDRLPVNFSLNGDTAMSPRRVLEARMAHCAEGAIFAAAALAYHGRRRC